MRKGLLMLSEASDEVQSTELERRRRMSTEGKTKADKRYCRKLLVQEGILIRKTEANQGSVGLGDVR
jgi:hypothetical protein